MGFVGLVPTEYSSGNGSTHRGHLTKAGNAHVRAQLVEGAWQYQHRPYVGVGDRKAPGGGGPPRPWPGHGSPSSACAGRFRHLAARKNTKSVVAAAVAHELAGFLWGEMTAAETDHDRRAPPASGWRGDRTSTDRAGAPPLQA